MAGGLMQLVAYGAQDVYLTGNPQITFWKVTYRRHTNFAMESIEQVFNGRADFGRRVQCVLSRSGDLAFCTYLQLTLPEINQNDALHARWMDYPGEQLIDTVEIEIGGQRIDRQFGEWLHIWNQLTMTKEQESNYHKMIGHTINLTYLTGDFYPIDSPCGTSYPGQTCLARNALPATTLYIPLQFWFNRNPGLALPLIALQYHEVRLTLDLKPLDECLWAFNDESSGRVTVNKSLESASLYVDYIYLDTDERRRMAQNPHEYLIEQLQFTGAESVGSTSNRISLDFNHPVKELVWVTQRDDLVDNCTDPAIMRYGPQYFNFTDEKDILSRERSAYANETLWKTVVEEKGDTNDVNDELEKDTVEQEKVRDIYNVTNSSSGLESAFEIMIKDLYNDISQAGSLDNWVNTNGNFNLSHLKLDWHLFFGNVWMRRYRNYEPNKLMEILNEQLKRLLNNNFDGPGAHPPPLFDGAIIVDRVINSNPIPGGINMTTDWYGDTLNNAITNSNVPNISNPTTENIRFYTEILLSILFRALFAGRSGQWENTYIANLHLGSVDFLSYGEKIFHHLLYNITGVSGEEIIGNNTKYDKVFNRLNINSSEGNLRNIGNIIVALANPPAGEANLDTILDSFSDNLKEQLDDEILSNDIRSDSAIVLANSSFNMHCWGENPVITGRLLLNGQERFSEREGTYFDQVQPYQHHTRGPNTGINVYSFALRPEDHQPSGTCNFSRIDNANLHMTLSHNMVGGKKTGKVRVYAVNYNILRILSGMGGLAYSN